METAEPVAYEFPGHGVGSFPHRRAMDSPLYPYYSHPTSTPYTLPYQPTPTTAAYSFSSGVLSQPSHPYQYFVASQPSLGSPVRLSSDNHQTPHHHHQAHHHQQQHQSQQHHSQHQQHQPQPPPPLQSLPEIRPAKNAINPVTTRTNDYGPASNQVPATGTDPSKKSGAEANFSTEVDVLMKAIQAKPGSSTSPVPMQQSLPPLQQLAPPGYPSYAGYPMSPPRSLLTNEGQLSRSGKKRKYTCMLPNCGKSFAQKTHLDIHNRAHSGEKPFICKEPSCGQRFSQLGNLKTHQRRHTGEKPFKCDICHKRFAQRGNVRAHQITHLQAKPFTCLLDSCGKKFTQLGNLKSHQNKFHSTTLRNLTLRFAQMGDAGPMNPADRELWEYFAELYKNSNKGIKGRGKDRRISTTNAHGHNHGHGHGHNLGHHRGGVGRMSSVESEEDRRGYEDGMGMYASASASPNGCSSSEGEEGGYYIERRGL
ncbi:putative C2H2 transcription factor (Azf1) [Penicillium brasilianum]|uniref:Putative C2H2 transcription factor (Azf1) n=1 Tax=Penicillium brasilianum TaxID=104259 RepID=A0A1S9S1C4_PENBI|nr:putative C2H2 transcription factor (Azf1) [Penicillium brasilianum]